MLSSVFLNTTQFSRDFMLNLQKIAKFRYLYITFDIYLKKKYIYIYIYTFQYFSFMFIFILLWESLLKDLCSDQSRVWLPVRNPVKKVIEKLNSSDRSCQNFDLPGDFPRGSCVLLQLLLQKFPEAFFLKKVWLVSTFLHLITEHCCRKKQVR